MSRMVQARFVTGLALAVAAAACGGGGGGGSAGSGAVGGTGGTSPPATSPSVVDGGTGTTSPPATSPSVVDGGTGTTSGTKRPVIGNLIASPDNADCVYQPGGAVGGGNAVQVFFYILLIGATPDQLPGLVHVTGSSDTGLA